MGCSQLSPKPNEMSTSDQVQSPVQSENATQSSLAEENSVDLLLSPQDMYRVLLAEMLVGKGEAQAGYELMYLVALKTRNPQLTERTFKLSMMTYDLNAISQASHLWREVSPEEPLAWKASYIMQAREGDIDSAVASWNRFHALTTNSLAFDVMESVVRLTQAVQPENGMAFLQQLYQQFQPAVVVDYALGMAAEAYKQYDMAIKQLQKTLVKLSSEVSDEQEAQLNEQLYRESNHLLANAYLKSGQSELGLVRLADYAKKHANDAKFQERYARLEVKVGQLDLAEARYMRVIKNEPDAHTSKLSAALLMLEREAYAKAEPLLQQLMSVMPYRSSALYYLGLASQRQQKWDQAKQYFKQITTDDYLVDARLHMAEIDFAKVGLDKTIEELDALVLNEVADQVKILQAKAIFYNRAGEKQKSIVIYDQAIALQDQKIELYLMQAMLFYDLSLFDQYEANLKQALAIDANDVEVLNALGYFYAEQKRELSYAQQLLEKALLLAPDRYYILDSRGWLAYQQGRYQEAESYLSQAFQQQVDEEVLIHLIYTLWKLERYDEAKKLWVNYRAQFPNNEVLQNLIVDLMQ